MYLFFINGGERFSTLCELFKIILVILAHRVRKAIGSKCNSCSFNQTKLRPTGTAANQYSDSIHHQVQQ